MKKRQRLLFLASIVFAYLTICNSNAEVITIQNNQTVTINGFTSVDLVIEGNNCSAVFDSNTTLNSVLITKKNPNAQITINPSVTVLSSTLNLTKSKLQVLNYGTFNCDNLTSNCNILNDGTLIGTELSIDGGTLTNNGSISFSGTISITGSGTIENNSSISSNENFKNYNAFSNSLTGEVIINGYLANYSGSIFENNGYVSTQSTLNNYGDLTNNDTLIVQDQINVSAGSITNNGHIKTHNTLKNSGEITNNGTLYVTQDIDNHEGASLTNNSYLNCDTNFDNTGTLANNGTIMVSATFSNNSTSNLNNTSFIQCQTLTNSTTDTLFNSGEITTIDNLENYTNISNTSSGVITTNNSYLNKSGASLINNGILRSTNHIKNYGSIITNNLLLTFEGYLSNYSTGTLENNADIEIAGNISNYNEIINNYTGNLIGYSNFYNYDNSILSNYGYSVLTSSFYNYGETFNFNSLNTGNFLNKDDALISCTISETTTSSLVCEDLYLQDNSFLNVEANCSLEIQSDLFIESTPSSFPRQLISGDIAIAKSVVIDHTYLGDAQWQFQTVPVNVTDLSVYGETFDQDYAIFYYDEAERSRNGHSSACWKRATSLEPGRGYIFIFATPTTVSYQLTPTEYLNSATQDITLQKTNSSINDNESGWNLVGNPHFIELDWDKNIQLSNLETFSNDEIGSAIYVYNQNTANYNSYTDGISINGQSGIISPLSAFFVKAFNNNATLSFSRDSYQSLAEARSSINQSLIMISFGNETSIDQTILRFKSGASAAFDSQYDAFKLPTNSNSCSIFTKANDGTDLAINTIDFPHHSGQKELYINAPISDNYSFSFNISGYENYNFYLVDKANNSYVQIQNSDTLQYHIDPNTPNRFILTYNTANPILTNDTKSVGNKSILYKNGTIYYNPIARESVIKVFTADGKLLFTNKLDPDSNSIEKFLKSGLYFVNIHNITSIVCITN